MRINFRQFIAPASRQKAKEFLDDEYDIDSNIIYYSTAYCRQNGEFFHLGEIGFEFNDASFYYRTFPDNCSYILIHGFSGISKRNFEIMLEISKRIASTDNYSHIIFTLNHNQLAWVEEAVNTNGIKILQRNKNPHTGNEVTIFSMEVKIVEEKEDFDEEYAEEDD